MTDLWDTDAAAWRASMRGTYLGLYSGRHVWRQFCALCNCPILATEPYKDDTSRTCDDCSRASGNLAPATAFGPERRLA